MRQGDSMRFWIGPVMILLGAVIPLNVHAEEASPEALAAKLDARGHSVAQMVGALQDAGITAPPDVTAAVWSTGRTDGASLAQALHDNRHGAVEAAIALDRISDGPDTTGVIHALRGAGYGTPRIVLALREIMPGAAPGIRGAEQDIIRALHQAETPAGEIGEGLREAGEVTVPRLAQALSGTGLSPRETGELLDAAGARRDSARLVRSLEDAEYSPASMALILYHAGLDDTRRITTAALEAGLSPVTVSEMIFSLDERVSRPDLFYRLSRAEVPLDTLARIFEYHDLTDLRAVDAMLADTRYDTNDHVRIWRSAGFPAEEATHALALQRDVGAVRAAATLERAGYSNAEIAKGLSGKFWDAEDTFDALRRVAYPNDASEVARALFSISFSVDESIDALHSHRRFRSPDLIVAGLLLGAEHSLQETARELIWQGYTSAEIRDALAANTERSSSELIGLLESDPVREAAIEWGLEETARMQADGTSGVAIAEHLKASGHLEPEHVAHNLETHGWDEPHHLVEVMAEAGFTPEEINQGILEIEQITKANVAGILHHLGFPADDVARGLNAVGVEDVDEIWHIMDEAGLPMEFIGEGLATVTAGGLELVLEGMDQAGLEPTEIAHVLKGFAARGTHSARQISQGLQEINLSPANIVVVLETMDQYRLQTIVNLLRELDLPAQEVAIALVETGYRAPTEVVQTFRNANFSPTEVLVGLREFGVDDPSDLVLWLTRGGFSPEATMEALIDAGYDTAEDLAELFREGIGIESPRLARLLRDLDFGMRETASALQVIGTSPMRIGSALYDAGWRNFRDITDALRTIGITGQDTLRTVLEFLGADDLEMSNIFG